MCECEVTNIIPDKPTSLMLLNILHDQLERNDVSKNTESNTQSKYGLAKKVLEKLSGSHNLVICRLYKCSKA